MVERKSNRSVMKWFSCPISILLLIMIDRGTALVTTKIRTSTVTFRTVNYCLDRKQQCSRRHSLTLLKAGNKESTDEERTKWLEKASQLREEVERLERTSKDQPKRNNYNNEVQKVEPVVVKNLDDSTWTLSYRFSDQPEPRDESQGTKRTFYSGKLTCKLRKDGYTDMISHEPSGETTLDIVKAWGWDLERSNEDEKEYLLFSIDVHLPKGSENNKGSEKPQKFYLQARKELDANDTIVFEEGTVTMKQEYIEARKAPGMWGLFSPRGILAEFRYVGDFVAKPSGGQQ